MRSRSGDERARDGDENRGVPCCVADAARSVTKVHVGGDLFGIIELGAMIDEVGAMGPMEDAETRSRLLERAGESNYIPPGSEEAYADGLPSELRRRSREGAR